MCIENIVLNKSVFMLKTNLNIIFCHLSFSQEVLPGFLYINLACLSVCLCTINVKTAEPIGPKFCVGPHSREGL